jgi:hypothetical protein
MYLIEGLLHRHWSCRCVPRLLIAQEHFLQLVSIVRGPGDHPSALGPAAVAFQQGAAGGFAWHAS